MNKNGVEKRREEIKEKKTIKRGESKRRKEIK